MRKNTLIVTLSAIIVLFAGGVFAQKQSAKAQPLKVVTHASLPVVTRQSYKDFVASCTQTTGDNAFREALEAAINNMVSYSGKKEFPRVLKFTSADLNAANKAILDDTKNEDLNIKRNGKTLVLSNEERRCIIWDNTCSKEDLYITLCYARGSHRLTNQIQSLVNDFGDWYRALPSGEKAKLSPEELIKRFQSGAIKLGVKLSDDGRDLREIILTHWLERVWIEHPTEFEKLIKKHNTAKFKDSEKTLNSKFIVAWKNFQKDPNDENKNALFKATRALDELMEPYIRDYAALVVKLCPPFTFKYDGKMVLLFETYSSGELISSIIRHRRTILVNNYFANNGKVNGLTAELLKENLLFAEFEVQAVVRHCTEVKATCAKMGKWTSTARVALLGGDLMPVIIAGESQYGHSNALECNLEACMQKLLTDIVVPEEIVFFPEFSEAKLNAALGYRPSMCYTDVCIGFACLAYRALGIQIEPIDLYDGTETDKEKRSLLRSKVMEGIICFFCTTPEKRSNKRIGYAIIGTKHLEHFKELFWGELKISCVPIPVGTTPDDLAMYNFEKSEVPTMFEEFCFFDITRCLFPEKVESFAEVLADNANDPGWRNRTTAAQLIREFNHADSFADEMLIAYKELSEKQYSKWKAVEDKIVLEFRNAFSPPAITDLGVGPLASAFP